MQRQKNSQDLLWLKVGIVLPCHEETTGRGMIRGRRWSKPFKLWPHLFYKPSLVWTSGVFFFIDRCSWLSPPWCVSTFWLISICNSRWQWNEPAPVKITFTIARKLCQWPSKQASAPHRLICPEHSTKQCQQLEMLSTSGLDVLVQGSMVLSQHHQLSPWQPPTWTMTAIPG